MCCAWMCIFKMKLVNYSMEKKINVQHTIVSHRCDAIDLLKLIK